jgi:hypothetical protein
MRTTIGTIRAITYGLLVFVLILVLLLQSSAALTAPLAQSAQATTYYCNAGFKYTPFQRHIKLVAYMFTLLVCDIWLGNISRRPSL